MVKVFHRSLHKVFYMKLLNVAHFLHIFLTYSPEHQNDAQNSRSLVMPPVECSSGPI